MSVSIKHRVSLALATAMLAPIVGILGLPAKIFGGLRTTVINSNTATDSQSLARNCLNCGDCLAVDRPRDQKS